MNQRQLNDAEKLELEALNLAVKTAIESRRSWLDAKMVECSSLTVGDGIYDLKTGQCLGKISRLYRYWSDRDEGIRDTSVYCDYEYQTSPNCYDNTSRQTGLMFGSRSDAANYAQNQANRLK